MGHTLVLTERHSKYIEQSGKGGTTETPAWENLLLSTGGGGASTRCQEQK